MPHFTPPRRGLGPVVHVVNHLRPGGIETMVLDLMRAQPETTRVFSLEGTRDDIVAGWGAARPFAEAIDGFGRQPGLSPALAGRLLRAFRRVKPRAVVLHHMAPFIYGGPAARAAGVRRLAYVEHDVWHYQESPRERGVARTLHRLLRPVPVAVSEPIAETLAEIAAPRAPVLAPPGVDLSRFAPQDRAAARAALGETAEGPLIGSAGRLAKVKGHDVLIDALARLPGDVRCLIAGDGEEREALAGRAEAAGLGDRLRLLGHQDDLRNFYAAIDLFCMPSRAEGLPRAALEAQACGAPLAATEVGALRDAACPEASVLAPPEDPDALAAALARGLKASERPAEAAARRAASRAFVAERYDFAKTIATFNQLTGIEAES